MITLNINAKLQPKYRFDIEDFIDKYLKEHNLGSVDGGGTSMAHNGEIEDCDINIDCNEENCTKIIEFLKDIPVPIGSKIYFDDEENDTEILVGNLEGLGFYFSNDLHEDVYKKYDINDVIGKFDELLEDKHCLYSYCQTNDFTAIYYYGESFVAMAEAIMEFVSSNPLCERGQVVELTQRGDEEVEINCEDSTMKNELYLQIEKLYDEDKEEEAILLYKNADESLKTPDVKSYIAVGYNNSSMYKEAVEILLTLENKTSNELKRLYRLAFAYWRLQDWQNCKDVCNQVFEIAKTNPELDINGYCQDCKMFYEDALEGLEDDSSEETVGDFSLTTYDEQEMEAIEAHITKEFGEFSNVYHELISPDIHVDICVINPTEERNYFTLVTMGMGAHKMNVPEELSECSRAELCITLPADWKLDDDDEIWYWPLRWLKILARLPIEQNTWLGHLHSIPAGEALADNTELEGFILDEPNTRSEEGAICHLPNNEIVNFYSIIPLHETEMSFKLDHGGDELLARLRKKQENIFLVDVAREACIDFEEAHGGTLDSAHAHMSSIYEKELDVDVFSAYNHLAIYLRWAIENDLTCKEFNENFVEVINMVKTKVAIDEFDLRLFLHKEFNGRLLIYFFNDEGAYFTAEYYGDNQYPKDVDTHAINYFNGKKVEHQDEDYLFVPYDEQYYQSMKRYIDIAYEEYKNRRN